MSLEEYNALRSTQSGMCGICKTTTFNGVGKTLAVDHNHETGEVRGLLCHSCNTALGGFKDSTEFLFNAIKWLKSNGLNLQKVVK